MKLPIYLDYNATTPVDPKVVEAMMPFFTESFGNAASRNHAFGWQVERVVEDARESIGSAIGADGKEIVDMIESHNSEKAIEAMNHHLAVVEPVPEIANSSFEAKVPEVGGVKLA